MSKRNRERKQAPRFNTQAQGNPEFWTFSGRQSDLAQPHLVGIQWVPDPPMLVPPEVAIGTARDLYDCAAYADLITGLRRHDFDADMISEMISRTIRRNHGHPDVFGMICPGSVRQMRTGMVLLARGERTTGLTPDTARELADNILESAQATIVDSLLDEAMRDVAHVDEELREDVFRYAQLLRRDPAAARTALLEAEKDRIEALKAEATQQPDTEEDPS